MPKRKPFNYASYLAGELKSAEVKGSAYIFNGWKIKVSNRGVYWHSKASDDFKEALNGLGKVVEIKGNKPFTNKKSLTEKTTKEIFEHLSSFKSKKVLNKEARVAKAAAKVEKAKIEKRAWCSGCKLCPQGVESKMCSSLKWDEPRANHFCSDIRWWDSYYCENAKRIVKDKSEPHIGYYECKITKERCPYNKLSIVTPGKYLLGNNAAGERFTTCKMYKGPHK